MEVEKLKDKIKEVSIDGMLLKYNVEFLKDTMIINKKIPVKDFIYLRNNIKKFRKINNVIVDADK